MAEMSKEMSRFIEEWEEVDRLRAEGKGPPVDRNLQSKMDSGSGTLAEGEETPWERLQREEAEASEEE